MKVSRALALVVSGWLILLLNYPSGRAEAATRLVNANTGNNVGNCLVSPCKTITYAVGQASSHDLIDVSWGTYDAALGESVPLNISMSLTLQGAGASVTTVAGIRVQGGAVDIRGFKIEGGVYYQGGPGTIDHNEIVNSQGDGIYCNQAAVTIHNNLIRGHKEYGIRNYAENNSIFNNTIVENGWGGYGGGVAALMSSPIVKNNIIVANIGYGIETNNFIPYTENDYNDVWNNSLGNYHSMVTPGPHSRSADPLFVSPSDLHPQCGPLSPVINTGDNSEVGSITADLTGNPRIVGDVVDMGAYEAVCNRFVADSGSDSGFCLESWAPCRTIGYAVSQALAGDTVSVAAGLYDQALGESFPILINKKIYLSGFGARFTTVDAGGSNHVFSVSNSAPLIAGFRIRGGWNGILLENGGSATITRNILTGNGWHGLQSLNSSPKITNNILSANGWSGIAINGTAPAAITNNTIDGNSFHGIHIGQACGVAIYNNIISFNNQYGIFDESSGCAIGQNYNLFWGNILGYMGPYSTIPLDSRFGDPRFTNFYHLDCGSPAINGGTNSPPGGLSTTDIESQPRVYNGKVDIGAWERQDVCGSLFLYLPVIVR